MKLDPDDIEQIAASVARRLTDRIDPDDGRRYVDAAKLAWLLDVERDWIYRHAAALGGVRLDGPRGRLRFPLATLRDRFAPAASPPPASGRRRPVARPARGDDTAPVRLLPYLVESPQQQHKSSGRAAISAPPGLTPGGNPDA
jgi:hypothetical protein